MDIKTKCTAIIKGNTMKGQKFKFLDYNIIIAVIFISTFGAVILFSSNGDMKSFIEHLIFMVIGFAGVFILRQMDYKMWKKIAPACYVLAIFAILLLLTPLKVSSHGATRWIKLGITIQISEVVKFLMVIYMAYFLPKHLVALSRPDGVFKVWIKIAVIAGMILVISSNLSSCLILLMVTFCMTYISSNIKWFHHVTLIFLAAVIGILCWILLQNLPTEEQLNAIQEVNHQIVRIIVWLAPERYPDFSFQTMQGLYAIGSGGLFGVGLGNSTQSSVLPEASNDMIFCILCEQLGMFGAALLLILYGYLFYQILLVTLNAKTLFGRYICAGTLFFFAFQTMVNVAVVTGVIPNTGVTLPFLSSGGSALIIAFAQIGLVLSVYKHDVLDEKQLPK